MRETADRLSGLVERAAPVLRAIGEREAAKPALPGGWSRKQVIGHLIDSASNNHQRFVRAALHGGFEGPGYDQNGWVGIQAYQDAPWATLVEIWSALNRLLSYVLAHLPAEASAAPCRVGEHAAMPLEVLAREYLSHLRHHLEQIGIRADAGN